MDIRSICDVVLNSYSISPFVNCGINETFDSEKEKLISTRNLVLDKVQGTNRKTEMVHDAVLEWLNEAEKILDEEKMKETEEVLSNNNNNNAYFLWTCSAWKHNWLYWVMQKKMKVLNSKCEFEPFHIPIPGIEYFSSGNFECFKSTKEASDQLLEALQNDSCYIIGLYGMRGSGKTKLVKAVGEKAKFLKIFFAVIFVSVSQRLNVSMIQHEIAGLLALEYERDDSDFTKASSLYFGLQSQKRLLLILDDVREKLELEDIGIPLCSNQCLLTTRSQQVCSEMKCEREIPMHPLSEEEAWKLFKKHMLSAIF